MIELHNDVITVTHKNGLVESHLYAPAEALRRFKFVTEALTWVGTPFRDCADIKGAGVDCAMLMTRCAIDTGLLRPFDPRPYPPRWHVHQTEERFLGWIEGQLGAVPTKSPTIGDVVVWKFGKCFSHGAIIISDEEVVHSYYAAGMCLISRRDEALLNYLPLSGHQPREAKYLDLWSRGR